MANKPEASAAPPAAGKKKKPILLIGIVVAVLLLGGAGAAFFLFGAKKDKGGEQTEEAAEEHAKPPVYVTLDPFTVNLTSEGSERFLQVGIDLKVSGPEIVEKVKLHLPEIKNGVLLLLTSKRVEDLSGIEGKNTLREEIRDIVNKATGYYKAPPAPKPSIDKTEATGEAAPAEEKSDEAKLVEEKPTEKPVAKPPKVGVLDVLLTSFVIQ